MPINAVRERNDARAAAFLLATTARQCIDDPVQASTHETALNNVFRLLEAFRVNQFFGKELAADHYSADTFSLSPPRERHVGDVRDALAGAVIKSFAGQTKNDAIGEVTEVLRRVAYPDKFGLPTPEQKAKAASFFSNVADQL